MARTCARTVLTSGGRLRLCTGWYRSYQSTRTGVGGGCSYCPPPAHCVCAVAAPGTASRTRRRRGCRGQQSTPRLACAAAARTANAANTASRLLLLCRPWNQRFRCVARARGSNAGRRGRAARRRRWARGCWARAAAPRRAPGWHGGRCCRGPGGNGRRSIKAMLQVRAGGRHGEQRSIPVITHQV